MNTLILKIAIYIVEISYSWEDDIIKLDISLHDIWQVMYNTEGGYVQLYTTGINWTLHCIQRMYSKLQFIDQYIFSFITYG